MIPLIYADSQKEYIIQKVSKNSEVRQHLLDLGIKEGTIVKIVNQLSGNMILEIMNSRIAIGKDLVKTIFVKEA